MVIADPSEQRVAPAIIEQAARFRGALCSEACRSVAIGDAGSRPATFPVATRLAA